MNAPESFTTSPHSRAEEKPTDVRITAVELYLLPVATRLPLKFGAETLTTVTCARVRMTVVNRRSETAVGWGETPLSVPWVWPSSLSYAARDRALQEFCRRLAAAWAELPMFGHAMEIGDEFLRGGLTPLLHQFNSESSYGEPMPHLAGLVCTSAFDIALHDAYGQAAGMPVCEMYNSRYMNRDLSTYLEPDADSGVEFRGKYPSDYFRKSRPQRLPVWHLVGGLDVLEASELTGDEPNDGYPTLLRDWIAADGLKCLKVKLRGNDNEWDFQRMVRVGQIAAECGVEDLTADFNCMVSDPHYVTDILDRLESEQPHIYDKILYVEQPFPYDLEANRIDVHSLSERKPLLMDESAHDWRLVRLGRSLGWNGVALKTCKTQTGALLTLSWAAAHGLHLMVQDLTNPMLAQIPHVLLAAHAETMRGVESNAMQFYPEASQAEAAVHPGLYRRRGGELDLSTIAGPGFGYRLDEIRRPLPEPVVRYEASLGGRLRPSS